MTLEETNRLEQAVVYALNLDGWELSHTGDGFERYDAQGLTPKGKKCVIEMKFRNEYYDCLLYTSPSPRDRTRSRMPSSA